MLTHQDIRTIAEDGGWPRISLFLPTHKTGREVRQDSIRLKNLLQEAAERLEQNGFRRTDSDRLLHDASARLPDSDFWQHQDLGLAVYVSPDETRWLPVPLPLDEQVVVGTRFAVAPLLPLLMRDGRFYLTAASQRGVDLYEGSRFTLTPIEDERLSEDAFSRLQATQFEGAVGFHGNPGQQSTRFHSLGETPEDEREDQRRQFAIHAAAAIDEVLGAATAPLVLVADDRLLGQLRQHLRYVHVAEADLREHPASLDPERLHQRAYEIVRPRLDSARQAALELFRARAGAGEDAASDRIEDILPAAAEGRGETLLVRPGTRLPGRFDPATLVVHRTGSDPEAGDLVETAVLAAVETGAAVYTVPESAGDLPPLAALFRY